MRTVVPALVLALGVVSIEAAAQTRPTVVVKHAVVYGEVQGAGLLADLAYPQGQTRLPAIMYVHGGRWRSGSRANANSEALFKWAEQGFFTMSIDYRLVGATPAPAAYEDTLCAIRWLHAHASEYGVDPDRIFLIGESSGGHLVSLAASLGQGPYAKAGGWPDARSDVKAVISVAGTYDLNTLSWGNLWTPFTPAGGGRGGGGQGAAPQAPLQVSAAGTASLTDRAAIEAARRQASPLFHLSATTKPILVIHSDDDQSVPIQQAVDFVKALETANVQHRFVHYTDRGHMGLTAEVLAEARKFIDEVEKRK